MGRSKDTLRMQPGVWYMAPKLVYDLHEEISKDTRWIYGYLCRSASEENTSFPSYNRIQKVCKVARATVSKALKELQEHGLLKVEARYKANGARHSNKYTLVVPESNMDEMSLAMAQFMKGASQEQKGRFWQMAKQFFSENTPVQEAEAVVPSPAPKGPEAVEQPAQPVNEKPPKTEAKAAGAEKPQADTGTGNRKGYGEFGLVMLTDEEHGALAEKYSRAKRDSYISKVDTYMKSKGKKYNDHYATILMWIKRDEDKLKNEKGEEYKPGDIIPPKRPGDFAHRKRDWAEIERMASEQLDKKYGSRP